MPLDAKCFLINLSVPYQLNPGVLYPIRGKCTLAEITNIMFYFGDKLRKSSYDTLITLVRYNIFEYKPLNLFAALQILCSP